MKTEDTRIVQWRADSLRACRSDASRNCIKAEDMRILQWRADTCRLCWSEVYKIIRSQMTFRLFSDVQTILRCVGQKHIETV
jgi:hypothetical protein